MIDKKKPEIATPSLNTKQVKPQNKKLTFNAQLHPHTNKVLKTNEEVILFPKVSKKIILGNKFNQVCQSSKH